MDGGGSAEERRKQVTPLIGGWGVENPKPVKGASLGGLGWAPVCKDGASPPQPVSEGGSRGTMVCPNPKLKRAPGARLPALGHAFQPAEESCGCHQLSEPGTTLCSPAEPGTVTVN